VKVDILFYTRKDFGGWRTYTWWPVEWVQGKYVHCEVLISSRILNANNRGGVEWKPVSNYRASALKTIEVDDEALDHYIDWALGAQYSWEAFFKLLWPKWGEDPKGMICSELAADLIATTASDPAIRSPFIAVPPHRWSPNQIFNAIGNLENEGLL